jgi:hypothetical protein
MNRWEKLPPKRRKKQLRRSFVIIAVTFAVKIM